MKPNRTTLLQAFRFAFDGIAFAFSQRNFRIQCAFALLACLLNILLSVSLLEWCIVIILIGAVLSAEALNTAIESCVDLVTKEVSPLAKHAKDCAAGAVLILSFAALIIAGIIYIPKLLNLLSW